ncbi:predicted protein [Sclerotinia sclerotiorum 1980 UF-70]|uniref:Uncharacterized protein n=1 Tax=Sclerotinia sclerotiorum (strain ATCC 18683 / 1980 / Ss-1) TaxID=665079 RepID=A7EG63_SCLS1|nr:predicted protein [Sclerotinia sclerotiorum 1980 UF-70]EDO01829.1 predicted protein [Sclerotinia sclerotiorum 1980 UF-70]
MPNEDLRHSIRGWEMRNAESESKKLGSGMRSVIKMDADRTDGIVMSRYKQKNEATRFCRIRRMQAWVWIGRSILKWQSPTQRLFDTAYEDKEIRFAKKWWKQFDKLEMCNLKKDEGMFHHHIVLENLIKWTNISGLRFERENVDGATRALPAY